jgi:hypothetical protein
MSVEQLKLPEAMRLSSLLPGLVLSSQFQTFSAPVSMTIAATKEAAVGPALATSVWV